MKKFMLLSVLVCSHVVCAEPITLMTFNIRYGTANDGENSWEHRKDHVVQTIREAAPWAIAIQEALLDQLIYIEEALPMYKKVGVHRDGGTEGEFSGLLIDVSKLEITKDGQIWLSESPDEVSKGWDAVLERTSTWAIVRQTGTTGPTFLLFSTHFDHRGTKSRVESAALVTQKANELSLAGGLPVAIMGDFNCSFGSKPVNIFQDNGYNPAVPKHLSGGTFHGFKGHTDGPRIDFIFLNDKWNTNSSEILRPRREGRSASDHDPVIALVETVTPRGTIGMPRNIQDTWKPTEQPFVEQWIFEEFIDELAKVQQVIKSRLETETDYHELSHVAGAFNHPLALPELAGSLTDRLKVLHCEPSTIQSLAATVLDAQPKAGKMLYNIRPSAEQVLEFLAIPDETFYIKYDQSESATEVINYSRQVDFAALVDKIKLPVESTQQPFFGKAMPPGVTGSVLAGQMGPDGWRVVGGDGPNTYDMTLIAEVFDTGGDDKYFANDIVVGNRLVIDLGGNDIYTGTESQGPAAGLFGIWIIDDRGGDDIYGTIGGRFSTGAAAFGVGMIIDRGGNDSYRGTGWSIGAAVYGAGIIIDLGEGDDEYLGEFLTIGVGGPRGFGFVFDERGDEFYTSDGPKPSAYDIPDVYCAFSQGMGFGYRNYAAGGIGILCDVAGDDTYQAGEFSQGGAYYHALGILRDFSGDDVYIGNRYSQGFGVHQAFGALVDDSGDDTYWATTAAVQGSAWDIAAGALVDKCGDDTYTAERLAQGSAAQHAIAYLIDLGGEDVYISDKPAQGASGSNRYHWDSTHSYSFSLLLDLGGDEDSYSLIRMNNTSKSVQVSPQREGRGFGLFIDQ